MKKLLSFALVALTMVGCKSVNGPDPVAMDVYDNVPIVTSSGAVLNNDQIRKIIVKAAEASNWRVENSDATGPVMAKYTYKEKHIASVRISYTQRTFSIAYENSVNLKYRIANGSDSHPSGDGMSGTRTFYPVGTKLIHGVYNQWVASLKDKIQAGFRGE
jgi:hypothetical protein